MMDSEVLYHYPGDHWVLFFKSNDGDAFKLMRYLYYSERLVCVPSFCIYTMQLLPCFSFSEKRVRKKSREEWSRWKEIYHAHSHIPVLHILLVKCTLSKKVTKFLPSIWEVSQARR